MDGFGMLAEKTIKKQAILIASAGTACLDSKETALACIQAAVAERFPGCELRQAFTSGRIIEKLKAVYGLEVDSVELALEKAAAEGVRRLVVLPLHLTHGREYEKIVSALREWGPYFEQAVLGEPLLSGEADFSAVLEAVVQRTAAFNDGRTAVCLVGHGSGRYKETAADDIYGIMQDKLAQAGYDNYFVGVLHGRPALNDIQNALQRAKAGAADRYRRVVLLPFMAAAGCHARRDITGEQGESWKRALEREGYEVVCILEGLGQLRQVRDLYVEHIRIWE